MSRNPRIHVSAIVTFLLVLPALGSAQAWVDGDWAHRMSLTAKSDLIAGEETFVDFPLHIRLDGPGFLSVFGNAKPDGSDLLVTAGDGITVLDREVVSFDPIAQAAEIWVRVPAFSRTENQFYLYYGNPQISLAARPAEAWSPGYRAVYHFDEDPGQGVLRDSSPHRADIALVPSRQWTSSDVMEGPLRRAWDFNGTTHHLATSAISSSDSSFVISAWLEHRGPGIDVVLQANPGYWEVSSQVNAETNSPGFAESGASVRWMPDPIPFDGDFHHFAWVFDGIGDALTFYFDGEPQVVVNSFPIGFSPLDRARLINPGGNEPVGVLSPMYFNSLDLHEGGGDEFRVRDGVVSPAWLLTEFRNQHDPLGFFEIGGVQNDGVTATEASTGTILSGASPNPFSGTTSVRFSLARSERAQLTVYDAAGRVVRRLLDHQLEPGVHEYRWNGRAADGSVAAAGVYFVRLVTGDTVQTSKLSFVR